MKNPFTDHPHSIGESYVKHLGAAWGFSARIIGAGMACWIHGVLPFWFTSTGSSAIKKLHEDMQRDFSL